MDETVNIIGAGPAGLTAAIVLARHGVPVKVYEATAAVGARLNGDFQGLENWSSEQEIPALLAEIGVACNFLCAPYHGGTIYAPAMPLAGVVSARPIFYLVQRGTGQNSIDTGLKEQVLALGVPIVFNHRPALTHGPTIVGTGPTRVDAYAVGVNFSTDLTDRAAVLFDEAVAPKGYAYLLTHGGRGTLATVLYRDFQQGATCFNRLRDVARERLGLEVENGRQFSSYGNFFIRTSQLDGNRLYVGESAGFQDALWGFGLRYAIVSGWLAARSIIDGSDYDRLWQTRLRPQLETSLVNRFLFESFGHAGYRYLTGQFRGGDPCDYLRRHYNASLGKRLLFPLVRVLYGKRLRKAPMVLDIIRQSI